MSEQFKPNRVVLVTGASTGIGLALVKVLQHSSFRVVATARASSLGRFAEAGVNENANFWIRPLEVGNAEQLENLMTEIRTHWQGVDVLVNNAAICYRAVVEHLDSQDLQDQMQSNFIGPMQLIQACLPYMRQKRQGHIINISSVGGMMSMPTMGGYCASKFALEGISEALWYELRPWGVNVSLVEPGFINSMSFQRVKFSSASGTSRDLINSPYHAYYTHMGSFIEKVMRRATSKPQDIANIIVKTLSHPKPPLRVLATLDSWFFYFFRRLMPSRVYHFILFRFLPNIQHWVEL